MGAVNPEDGLKENRKFAVHSREAKRPHYDLGLERGGVFKSWAVPRGMPENPGVKRLAVEVEDHPLDYFGFEGTIPEGRYGAGKAEVWDLGTYVVEAWEKDRITVEFIGKKLSGRYALVRFMEKNWLVIKVQAAEKVHLHRRLRRWTLRRTRKVRLIPSSPIPTGASHLELFEQPE
ncbi:MAG: hypothetical protein HS130_00375 [Deltaproteobacteria bacterium]|nr:hypothetical protein [Deltaproteobacteria bacterium]MCL4873956.1 hypothetical protein [bacterium]